MLQFEEPGHFLCQSSDEDLIFLGQASISIKNDLKKKERIFHERKKHLEKDFLHKNLNFLYCKMLLLPFITYTMIIRTYSLSYGQALRSEAHPLFLFI